METFYVISARPPMGMAQAQLPGPRARTQQSGVARMVRCP
jgi:hypothetical protein